MHTSNHDIKCIIRQIAIILVAAAQDKILITHVVIEVLVHIEAQLVMAEGVILVAFAHVVVWGIVLVAHAHVVAWLVVAEGVIVVLLAHIVAQGVVLVGLAHVVARLVVAEGVILVAGHIFLLLGVASIVACLITRSHVTWHST